MVADEESVEPQFLSFTSDAEYCFIGETNVVLNLDPKLQSATP